MHTDLDYRAHLARESARFAEVVRRTPPDARVPTCPDWNADDLLWHLAEVQWFWGTVVRERITGPQAEKLKPQRPADRAGLLAFYDRASRDLGEILAATPPGTAAWTWSPEQTTGFIRRRQTHEALIHRIDAELTAGERTPADPDLSADGVDEALRVMYGATPPPWGTFTPDHAKTLRLHASDTGDSWFVTVGWFEGTDPDDGTSYSEPHIRTADADADTQPAAVVRADAADLDCWLWRRPPAGTVVRYGGQDALDGFESVIAPGIS
ncbi:MAG TPA: maleylpyruvate isomerase family mycothiol-dependent enzyme [Streptosporangiaceae bacterium]|nr:maleylpyruvate isomerase family mycothiol-dependent enzyme [Streptosporangiaceae bacterium]